MVRRDKLNKLKTRTIGKPWWFYWTCHNVTLQPDFNLIKKNHAFNTKISAKSRMLSLIDIEIIAKLSPATA